MRSCERSASVAECGGYHIFVNTNPRDEEASFATGVCVAEFFRGDLSGSFNYTLPTVLAGGSEATGTLTWTLLVDGVEAASGEGMPEQRPWLP